MPLPALPSLLDQCAGRPARRAALTALLAVVLSACASAPPRDMDTIVPLSAETRAALPAAMMTQRFVLMGEVHDNPFGHAWRTQALTRAVEAGWRPAIAMEQFDTRFQPLLDLAMATCTDAPCVIAAAVPGKSAWEWTYYEPIIDLALKYKLRLLAANLSRADASKVVRGGLSAVFSGAQLRDMGLAVPPHAELMAAQEQAVADGHCGVLPAAMHGPMATAQIARDAVMADVMRTAAGPVVLLAGNGHVRKDIGVPQWLGAPSLSIGFIEGRATTGAYDQAEGMMPIARPDPCEAVKSLATSTPGTSSPGTLQPSAQQGNEIVRNADDPPPPATLPLDLTRANRAMH
ncbi:ChaN family lipoprotein [Pigmentiphaga litoralis]|uniref:Putative iron-regulated protein n=1 Tax=Pigmentiphaga litoralis TaxID=516702 RepID=A0A7Y9IVD6_9BURK|nr:ChaN family lipoprotein [Pigmentiphaga litoralis]NYE22825.1 putative iron-regulated protein [Pigmentiphaga litoralis]NYE83560.1 putative iron-regulated protein [Pigmentiphaga litoralis]